MTFSDIHVGMYCINIWQNIQNFHPRREKHCVTKEQKRTFSNKVAKLLSEDPFHENCNKNEKQNNSISSKARVKAKAIKREGDSEMCFGRSKVPQVTYF